MFLGANQDAIASAAQMGIQAHNSATFMADDDDIKAGSEAMATVPSAHSARLWPLPAATAITVLPERTPEVLTATGTLLLVVEPLPSWP